MTNLFAEALALATNIFIATGFVFTVGMFVVGMMAVVKQVHEESQTKKKKKKEKKVNSNDV